MHYKVNDDYTNFIREPKFELDFISNSQTVECLRIIKNNTNNKIKQTKIQSCIDDVFNGVDESLSARLTLISNYFFDGELLITCENKNIRINFCKDYNYYFFENNYEDLNFEEQILIKKSRVTYVSPNKIIIQHKDKNCICRFNYSSIERIQNLLKNRDYCDYLEIEEMLEEFKIDYPNANPIPEPIEKSINKLEDVELFHFLNSRNVSIKEYKIQFNFGEYVIEWKYKDSLEEVKKFLQGLDIVITKNHEIFESSKQIVIEKEKSDHELINRIVKEHFENKIALKNSINPNIRIKKEKDYNFYYLTNKFERLKDEELIFD